MNLDREISTARQTDIRAETDRYTRARGDRHIYTRRQTDIRAETDRYIH